MDDTPSESFTSPDGFRAIDTTMTVATAPSEMGKLSFVLLKNLNGSHKISCSIPGSSKFKEAKQSPKHEVN